MLVYIFVNRLRNLNTELGFKFGFACYKQVAPDGASM